MTTTSMTAPITPWYRQLWPWLLMAGPATAVVAGIFTWWLAATANNSLVVDDYYREGKAINQRLARDRTAFELGLQATLVPSPAGVELKLASSRPEVLPEKVSMRLVHATRAELDYSIELQREPDGVWRASQPLPREGRWTVHLEDDLRTWRLVEPVSAFDRPVELHATRP